MNILLLIMRVSFLLMLSMCSAMGLEELAYRYPTIHFAFHLRYMRMYVFLFGSLRRAYGKGVEIV